VLEGECQDRPGGGTADARQACDRFNIARKISVVLFDDNFGGALQVARAGVVTEPGPVVQYAVEFGARQCLHIREAFQEALIVRNDRAHLGLLEHDLRYPDAVRIARTLPG
jgi:hypothetical protein